MAQNGPTMVEMGMITVQAMSFFVRLEENIIYFEVVPEAA